MAWAKWKEIKKEKGFPVHGKEKQITWMLGDQKGAEIYAAFVEGTGFFEDICKAFVRDGSGVA